MPLPKHRRFIPSPAGVSLARTFHWSDGLLFCVGGVLGWWFERKDPELSAELTFMAPSLSGDCSTTDANSWGVSCHPSETGLARRASGARISISNDNVMEVEHAHTHRRRSPRFHR